MFFGFLLLSCLFSSTCLVFQPFTTCNSAIKAEIPHQDLIKINFSSQKELIKTKLGEVGLTGALFKDCTDAKERDGLIRKIINRINAIYGQQGYIDSSVKDYRLTDAGNLEINCSENAIPKSNFRFYVQDPKFGQYVKIKNLINSSSSHLPLGKFTQIESEYLARKLFRGKELIRIDPVIFKCIKNTRLYKDLEYVIHRGDDGNIYCDVFCQGFGRMRSISPGFSFSQEKDALLHIVYKDANFMDTKSVFRASGRVNLQKFLKLDHVLQLQFISDLVDSALWDHESIDCSLMTIYTDACLARMGEAGLSIALMRRLRGFEVVTSTRVDPKTLSVSTGVSKRCQIGTIRSSASFGHNYAGTEENTFRVEQQAALNLGKYRINAKYIATNKLSYGDFRGDLRDDSKEVTEEKSRYIIASHELLVKLFKPKISPFAGIFCDVSLEKHFGISAGIKVSILNLTLSLPLFYLLPKGLQFPQISKLFKHAFPMSETNL